MSSAAEDFTDPDDEDLIGLDEPTGWAERRAAEATGQRYADDLLAEPRAVREAALYGLALGDSTAYTRARYGPSQEALDVETEVQRLRVRRLAKAQFDLEHADHDAMPALVSLTALLEKPDEEVRYRVDGLWPSDGRVVLAAQNKSGKTTLTNNLVRSLVDGDPFLGSFEVEPAERVVVIDNEMSEGLMQRWLRDQGIQNTDAVDLVALRGRVARFNILDDAIRTEWAELVGPADVLIFDCLRPVLDALGLSEDKDSGQFLVKLDALVRQAGVKELLLVHHMGHSNERSRGDSRLQDWPDANWKLVREDPDNPNSPSYFKAFGRDVDQPEVRLAFDPETRHLEVNGGSRHQARSSDLEAKVQLFVGENPGCSQSAIEHGITGDRTHIRRAVKQLVAAEYIVVSKHGQKFAHFLHDSSQISQPR